MKVIKKYQPVSILFWNYYISFIENFVLEDKKKFFILLLILLYIYILFLFYFILIYLYIFIFILNWLLHYNNDILIKFCYIKGCPIKKFEDCDFTPITEYFAEQKEKRKAMTKEDKEVCFIK